MAKDILRGRIVSMYRTVLAFANELGWSSRKIYDIVNGKQEPTAKEIEEMCGALRVEIPEDMKQLFFS